MQELRVLAKSHKINSVGVSKIDIIRAIQRKEGNFDCYASAHAGECDQGACLWRLDCLEASQMKARH